jgi:O-antigen ligase
LCALTRKPDQGYRDRQETHFMTTLTTRRKGRERSADWMTRAESIAATGRRPFVFGALLTFSALYYYRPEDFIPGLNHIPMAKIVGIIGILALIVGMMGGGKAKIPLAVKVLWLLLFQMMICIPFAVWRNGAFSTVFDRFDKGVVVATLIGMAVVTVRELRKLLWIQVSAVALVTFLSIVLNHHEPDGRLTGVQKSILENPNDLAINIAISFPLCVAFMLHARGFKKVLWALGLVFMSLGIVLTYSRSGLLAFLLSVIVCVWEYGIKGKRHYVVAVAGVALLVGLGVAFSSAHYRARVESIFMGNIGGSGDQGSLESRKALLKKSVVIALTHPIFGVGPGCFPLIDKNWLVAHNTYTELAAEAGIPGLILFLMAIGLAFKNIAQVRKSQQYREDAEFRLFTQALWAGLTAYIAGACFASTEYNLYPYFMVAYTCAMVRITSPLLPGSRQGNKDQRLSKTTYDRISKPQPIWSR